MLVAGGHMRQASIVEAYHQSIKTIARLHPPPTGHMRGVDFYCDADLRRVLANALELFYSRNHFAPNIVFPRTFNEFIFRRKFLESLRTPLLCSKFYTNRRVVAALGEAFASRIVYAGTSYSDLLERMREQPSGPYFLKADHGSGMNRRFVWDQARAAHDDPDLAEHAAAYLQTPFGFECAEWQYSVIPRLLLVERSLVDDGVHPVEYCFFVFGHTVRLFNATTRLPDGIGERKTFFDQDGRQLPLRYSHLPARAIEDDPLPDNINEFKRVAETVAAFAQAPFVRVDLYDVEGRPVVGEITYTPANATYTFRPGEYDVMLGDYWRTAESETTA